MNCCMAGVLGAHFRLCPLARVICMAPTLFYPVFITVPAFFHLFIWFWSQFFNGALALLEPGHAGGYRLVGAYRRLRGRTICAFDIPGATVPRLPLGDPPDRREGAGDSPKSKRPRGRSRHGGVARALRFASSKDAPWNEKARCVPNMPSAATH